MKKLFLITVILLLQSFPSYGERERLEGVSSYGDWKIITMTKLGYEFINIKSLRIKSNKRLKVELYYFNYLTDYYEPYSNEPMFKSSLSKIDRYVFDCNKKLGKRLRSVFYLESMGKGNVVYEEYPTNSEWKQYVGSFHSISFYTHMCR